MNILPAWCKLLRLCKNYYDYLHYVWHNVPLRSRTSRTCRIKVCLFYVCIGVRSPHFKRYRESRYVIFIPRFDEHLKCSKPVKWFVMWQMFCIKRCFNSIWHFNEWSSMLWSFILHFLLLSSFNLLFYSMYLG